MNKKSGKNPVIVLGSPRGGTSLTAGILHQLGVDMGDIREPDPENPKGYFEDKNFLSLLDDILNSAEKGSHGFNLPSKKKIISQRGKFKDRIKDLIEERASQADSCFWGWKANTTSLCPELFLPYLDEPHFIIVFRNSLKVAESMVRYTRNKDYENLTLAEALKITNTYYENIRYFLDNNPNLSCYFIAFEELLSNPYSQVQSLIKFLDIKAGKEQFQKAVSLVSAPSEMKKTKKKAYFNSLVRERIPRFAKQSIRRPSYIPKYIKSKFSKK